MSEAANHTAPSGVAPTTSPALKYGLPGLAIGIVVGGLLGLFVSEFGGRSPFPVVLTAQVNKPSAPSTAPADLPATPRFDDEQDVSAAVAPSDG